MLGRLLLFAALGFAVYAGFAAPASTRRRDDRWTVVRPDLLESARRALWAVLVCVGGAALLLWYAFFTRDFSIAYVAMNTSRGTQPWYTFSGLWAGMPGSLLLWCLFLAVYATVFAARRRPEAEPFVPWAIPVLCSALVFYLAITAGAENPFAPSEVIPVDGRGMNPLLHSPGMVIHPPVLYAGLVGVTVPFALLISALVTGRTGTGWVRVVRRWMLVAWLALGVGLVLGGAWAYTELGWGGYWGWDPVENAALMPWLAATAFLHSAVVQERRGMLQVWNVFLVITAAALATFGTFLTRSGLLSSVHAFAESPIGRWFFVYLGAQTLLGLGLLAWRLPRLRARHRLDGAVSKETGFLLNNLLFVGVVVVVLWGTILPLITETITGRQVAVGPPFFNRVLSPVGAMLLLLAAVGPVLPWRRGTIRGAAARLRHPALVATAAAAGTLIVSRRPDFAGLMWIGVLLGSASLLEIWRAAGAQTRATGGSVLTSLGGLFPRNPRRYGGYLVHLGVAVMFLGFAGSLGRTQAEIVAEPGDRFAFAGYDFTFRDLDRFAAADKDVNLAILDVHRRGDRLTTLRPQLNIHRNWDQPQSEIAIRTTPAADLYVILAATSAADDQVVFRIHANPMVFWVWAGSVLASIGGLVALLARRRRKPQPASTPIAAPDTEVAWTR